MLDKIVICNIAIILCLIIIHLDKKDNSYFVPIFTAAIAFFAVLNIAFVFLS